jgi:hypothetical protein
VGLHHLALAAALSAPKAPNIHVYSCQVVSGTLLPQNDEIGLAVRFMNNSSDTLSSIVWRAKYRSTWVDFIDDGTFSPATRIDNYVLFEAGTTHFNWLGAVTDVLALAVHAPANQPVMNSPNMFVPYVSYDDPQNCGVVRTISDDGTLWINPDLVAQKPFVFPSPAPSVSPSAEPSATPSPVAPPSIPIDVTSCSPAIGGEGELGVRFTNLMKQAAKRVVFRIPYKDSAIDFTDEGTFSQNVAIMHGLKRSLPDELRRVAYVPFADPSLCNVVTVQYEDGTTWQNPQLSASPAPLPAPVPDAIDWPGLLRGRWSQRHGMPTPIPSSTPAVVTSTRV